jgi:hypothetical protein
MTRTIAGALLVLLAGCATPPESAQEQRKETRVVVIGKQLYVNGTATTLLGFHAGGAALLEPWTNELLAQLDDWQRHGVNAITVSLQGKSGGRTSVFTANGAAVSDNVADVVARAGYGLDEAPAVVGRTSGAAVVERAKRIVEAANQRGMVVVLGIVYRAALHESDTEQVLTRAMGAAAAPFKDYPNVIFNVWNGLEAKHPRERPEAIAKYVTAIRAAAPGRPVCAGSFRSETNPALAALPGVDLVCQDAGRSYREAVAAFEALGAIEKPVINVESYGDSGGGYVDDISRSKPVPAEYFVNFSTRGGWQRMYGVWEEEDYRDAAGRPLMGKRSYRALISYVAQDTTRQRHLLVQAAGWFQGASRVELPGQIGDWRATGKWNNTFHPGLGKAQGTVSEPGIRWLLEEIARTRTPSAGK